ncbi:hypothetical protein Cgig2_023998 [Carnegiea gigantea]|uniref:Uncharacterized protein n=1 Tax=Carnegiea gigantea TaxID=171969 RepID=A0A9Q1QFA6_9CARY|nr:hypothetical protein Cgig2_023998 [Carnegiea gigantea]
MGNSLRCCLACVLPCGALDLTRIIHLNGYVEEVTGPVTAGEFLKAYPNHVLSKPSSQGVVRKILILCPESELKRGSFYFLIPQSSLPSDHRNLSDHKNPPISSSNKKTVKIQTQKINDGMTVSKFDKVTLDRLDLSTLNHKNVAAKSKSEFKSKSGGHRRSRSSRDKRYLIGLNNEGNRVQKPIEDQ